MPEADQHGREASERLALVPEEPTFELLEDLLAVERGNRLGSPVLGRDPRVVGESPVRRFERVLQLVTLEQIVVSPRRVARPVLGVDRAPDRPHGALAPLDPDHDPLVRSVLVHAVEGALGEPRRRRLGAHRGKDTIARVAKLSEFFRNPFSFLFARSSNEERVAAYIIREHERGRPLSEILEDPYIRNRTTPQERERLLDRPELIRAIGDDVIASVRGSGTP